MNYHQLIDSWYRKKNWTSFPFQDELAAAYAAGLHGLLNAPTGSGKTYAMFIPALCEAMSHTGKEKASETALRILWITPLRALARDITNALQHACDIMESNWKVEMRTGDTDTRTKQLQKKKMPEVLVITPESIHVLFTYSVNLD